MRKFLIPSGLVVAGLCAIPACTGEAKPYGRCVAIGVAWLSLENQCATFARGLQEAT